VREHVSYSNDIKDSMPDAIKALDKSIHDFSHEIGVRYFFSIPTIIVHDKTTQNRCQELYENIPTKGVEIITGLEGRLVEVCNGLSRMDEILTKNNVEENIKIGKEKYFGIGLRGNMKVSEYYPVWYWILTSWWASLEFFGRDQRRAPESYKNYSRCKR